MKSVTMNILCRVLILAMLSLSFQTASAGIISTDQAVAAATVQTDRAVVMAALSRSEITTQMQAQGLDPAIARERVASMTDQELHSLAGSIDSAPAGADGTLAAVVVIGLLVWFIWYRK